MTMIGRWSVPLLLAFSMSAGAAEPLDVVLRGGQLVDGTGAPPRTADVGLRAGRIAAIGDLASAPAGRHIDARGLVIAPGFIDVHNHADEDVGSAAYRSAPAMIHQGVTTAVFGVDGGLDLDQFRTLKSEVAAAGIGVNFTAYPWSKGGSNTVGLATALGYPTGYVGASNLKVSSSWGVAGQVGFDYMIDRHWGLNVDVKRVYMEPSWHTTNGLLAGHAHIDPWLIGAGITYRFGGPEGSSAVSARY